MTTLATCLTMTDSVKIAVLLRKNIKSTKVLESLAKGDGLLTRANTKLRDAARLVLSEREIRAAAKKAAAKAARKAETDARAAALLKETYAHAG